MLFANYIFRPRSDLLFSADTLQPREACRKPHRPACVCGVSVAAEQVHESVGGQLQHESLPAGARQECGRPLDQAASAREAFQTLLECRARVSLRMREDRSEPLIGEPLDEPLQLVVKGPGCGLEQ